MFCSIIISQPPPASKLASLLKNNLREIRELGEGIILVDRHPSLISLPALGNTFCSIVFGLKHKADMNTISESILLDREQVDFLGQLETGIGIVKLQGRYFKPFLVKFPLFPIKKGIVSDEEIKKKMRSYSTDSLVIRAEKEINELVRSFEGYVKDMDKTEKITEIERRFLLDILEKPISGIVERYQRLGINSFQENRIKNSLIEKGLIYWKSIPIYKGRIKALMLTHKGKKLIGAEGENKILPRNTSLEHEYWKQRVAEHYRKKGYKVTLEMDIGGGKKVDVVAEKDGKRIAIVIETGKPDTIYNIRKNLQLKFDEIVCFCLNNRAKNNLLSQLKEMQLSKREKIKVINIYEFTHLYRT